MVNDDKEPPIKFECRCFSSNEDAPGSEFYGSQVDHYSFISVESPFREISISLLSIFTKLNTATPTPPRPLIFQSNFHLPWRFGKINLIKMICGYFRGMRSGTVPHVLAVGLGAACEVAQQEMEVKY